MHHTADSTSRQQTERWLFLGVVLLAVTVRAQAVTRDPRMLATDVDDYLEFAETLRTTHTFGYSDGLPSAFRPVLYPLLLAAMSPQGYIDAGAIAGLHAGLGVATVALIILLGQWWELHRARFLAGALVACDPLLLRQSMVPMTETVATFLSALALVALTAVIKRPSFARACGAGAALGLAVLCRPTFLLWSATAPVALAWLLPHGAPRQRTVILVYLGLAVALAPWTIRNFIQLGRPVMTTTHGGSTLWLANNAEFYEHLREAPREPWDAADFNLMRNASRIVLEPPDEIECDRADYAAAWTAIRAEPALFCRACVFRVSRFWGVLPLALPQQGAREAVLRYATAAWYLAEHTLALVGLLSIGRRWHRTPWLLALLLAASFALVHTFYWTDMRMRCPVVPVVALLSATGAGWIASRIGTTQHE